MNPDVQTNNKLLVRFSISCDGYKIVTQLLTIIIIAKTIFLFKQCLLLEYLVLYDKMNILIIL